MALIAALYALTRSAAMAMGVLVGGVLIDTDHFIDFFIHGGIRMKWSDMLYISYHNLSQKIYLVLHSYELLILVWIAVLLTNGNSLLLGIALGFTLHMILDQIFNPSLTLTYFLLFRIIKRFECESIRRAGATGKPDPPPIERIREIFGLRSDR